MFALPLLDALRMDPAIDPMEESVDIAFPLTPETLGQLFLFRRELYGLGHKGVIHGIKSH